MCFLKTKIKKKEEEEEEEEEIPLNFENWKGGKKDKRKKGAAFWVGGRRKCTNKKKGFWRVESNLSEVRPFSVLCCVGSETGRKEEREGEGRFLTLYGVSYEISTTTLSLSLSLSLSLCLCVCLSQTNS